MRKISNKYSTFSVFNSVMNSTQRWPVTQIPPQEIIKKVHASKFQSEVRDDSKSKFSRY